MARYFIDPKNDKIVREDLYKVRVEKGDGTVISDLQPKRLFPFTRPNNYITLLEGVENAPKKEAAVIVDITELSEESRRALEDCFDEFYMIPKIVRVVETKAKFGSLTWKVETDRGPIQFRIRNMNSDIKMLDGKRMLVRDSNDNRYEIPDINALDKKSMHKLFPYT